jgi:hypothetical protein
MDEELKVGEELKMLLSTKCLMKRRPTSLRFLI